MSELVSKTLEIAVAQDGVREIIVDGHGTNTGKMVDEYLSDVGRPPGDAWCAAFVHWCADQAASELGVRNPIIRTGACEVIRQWALHHGLIDGQPQAGDLFLRVGVVNDGYGPVYRAHHTGFVVGVDADTIHTVEGNTNDNGSNEGIGVFRLVHPIDARRVYVRWSRLCSEPEKWTLWLDGAEVCDLMMDGGRALCPVRAWAAALGFSVGFWDGAVTFDAQEVPFEVSIVGGHGYVGVRELAAAAGLDLAVDGGNHKITVSRPGAA